MNNGLNGRENEMSKDLVKIFKSLQNLAGEDIMDTKFDTYLRDKGIQLTNQQAVLANVILNYLNTDSPMRTWFISCRSGKTFLFNTIENFYKEVIRNDS